MMKANRIAQLAKKWQRMAALWLSLGVAVEADECCTSMASKGHCVVYTADKRFEVPLAYLGTPVFAVLLQISQEEFGFVSDGRWVDLTSLWCRSHGVCHVPAQERFLCRAREGIPEYHGSIMPLCKLCGNICRS